MMVMMGAPIATVARWGVRELCFTQQVGANLGSNRGLLLLGLP
jgi:hypothetical protein